jgi:hypothetical protein
MSTDVNVPMPPPGTTDAPQRAARTRQIVYALAIVVLFGLMYPYRYWLQVRKNEADLGEASIGQIDTAGFAMKLLMIGGFRGLVANALWTQAIELQKQHEWDQLMTNVQMITKLQPHFLSVWTFQGWNLAYNVSVEWDAPEDKYTWIKKGINFLRDGVARNQNSPDLLWDTAWTYYHKIGFSDEAILLRGLFYRDPDDEGENFKRDPKTMTTHSDNFLVAKGWFQVALDLVDAGAQRVTSAVEGEVQYVDKLPNRKGRPGDMNFRAMPAHAQTRYAAALEKMSVENVEPQFSQVAATAWNTALRDWVEFGTYPFPVGNATGDYAEQKVLIDNSTRPESEIAKLSENERYWLNRFSDQMNYPYFKQRCQAEGTEQGVDARRLFYDGTLALRRAEFPAAVAAYRSGLQLWKDLLEHYPLYRDDGMNQKDTGHLVKRYVQALRNVGEAVPDDLPFKELYEAVKDEVYLDPYDQLDMMRVPPKGQLQERDAQ